MSTVHVYPAGDVIEHDTDTDDCWCGPTIEFSQGDAASGWVATHHSVDGREFQEADTPTWFLHTGDNNTD